MVSHDPLDPMGLIISSGTYGTDITMDAVAISIPAINVEQNVLITLQDDPIEPIQIIIARNYVEQPSIISTL